MINPVNEYKILLINHLDVYYTDGYFGYFDVDYPGRHVRKVRDKKDTHNVDSVNADLSHYIFSQGEAGVFHEKSKRFTLL